MDALIKPLRPGKAEGLPESEFRLAPARADMPRPSREQAEEAVKTLLAYIGEDTAREGLIDTPRRVVEAYDELFQGYWKCPAEVLERTFGETAGYDDLVLVRDIEVWSTCEHHLLPFSGVAHVAYIPSKEGRITGLSKLARLVDVFAKRPQVQERLTSEVADALVKHLHPQGVMVVIECEHLCMTMRGVRKPGSKTVTSAVRGVMSHPATRAEAMSLIIG